MIPHGGRCALRIAVAAVLLHGLLQCAFNMLRVKYLSSWHSCEGIASIAAHSAFLSQDYGKLPLYIPTELHLSVLCIELCLLSGKSHPKFKWASPLEQGGAFTCVSLPRLTPLPCQLSPLTLQLVVALLSVSVGSGANL